MFPSKDVLGEDATLDGCLHPIDNPAALKSFNAFGCMAG